MAVIGVAQAVSDANVPTLLMVLVHLTGDLRWLDAPYEPTRPAGLDDNDDGGLADDVQQEVRTAATEAITAWLGGTPAALPLPQDDELLVRMLAVAMGEEVPTTYAPMIRHELDLAVDRAAVGWDTGAPAPDLPGQAPSERDGPTVLVIGAGISGIAASVQLQRTGYEHVIVERGSTIGGVWRDNRYPGCGVDTPSHIYTFSFAPNDWTRYFALREEIADYLERVADEHDVRSRVCFQREAIAARWDEVAHQWTTTVRAPDGSTEQLISDIVITAVGAFNKPVLPDVPGRDQFHGPTLHTARWPEEGIDLSGMRVAVIGSGASAMQVVPELAEQVDDLIVFQRTPQWVAPFDAFRRRFPDGVRDLLRTVPWYHAWYRTRLGWVYNDRIHPSLQLDPDWEHADRSLNSINEGYRRFFLRYMREELAGHPDLQEAMTPDYPPYGKRILLDNGWFRTLARDDVTLVPHAVTRIGQDHLVATDGSSHEVDAIVFATGFDVARFVAPIEVTGRDSLHLRDEWDDDDPRAHLGSTVPGFPNLFLLYGPNTQFGHGGSVVMVLERQLHHVLGLLDHMRTEGLASLEVRREAYDAYTAAVDRAHDTMVWTHPRVRSYYQNSRGRVVVPSPFRVVDFWHMTEDVDPDAYVAGPARSRSAGRRASA